MTELSTPEEKRKAVGLEVRCGYSEEDLPWSQLAPEIGTARQIAEQWRQALPAKGGFEKQPTNDND